MAIFERSSADTWVEGTNVMPTEAGHIESSSVARALADLSQLMHRLSLIKNYVVLGSVLNLIATFAIPVIGLLPYPIRFAPVAMFPIVGTTIVIWAVYRFENLRSVGDTFFQEISDELEWHVRERVDELSKLPGPLQHGVERPNLSARLVLRRYSKEARLPFAPGALGPAAYVLFNVAMGVVFIVMFSINYRGRLF